MIRRRRRLGIGGRCHERECDRTLQLVVVVFGITHLGRLRFVFAIGNSGSRVFVVVVARRFRRLGLDRSASVCRGCFVVVVGRGGVDERRRPRRAANAALVARVGVFAEAAGCARPTHLGCVSEEGLRERSLRVQLNFFFFF
jgi:hypothetical protein